jgi:hypothetical protein
MPSSLSSVVLHTIVDTTIVIKKQFATAALPAYTCS